jgi:hypothetical protein
MNIDLGSPALDIAIGLSFVFFLLSVIASALTEFWSGVFNLRAKTLKQGLEGMIGDKGAVEKLLDHPLVRTELTKEVPSKRFSLGRALEGLLPRARRKYERTASYIAPDVFASAFTAVFGESSTGTSAGVESTAMPASLRSQTAELVDGSDGSPPPPIPPVAALEKWFDDGMDRVSGWYKRKSQIWTVVFATVVVIGLNASALRIVERLNAEPTVRAAVVAKAEAAAAGEAPAAGGSGTSGVEEIKQAGEDVSKASDQLDALKLPLFWAGENLPETWDLSSILTLLAGWFLTIVAVCLGAPFWFDTLGRLSNLRMTGKKPDAATGTAKAGPAEQ